ncbi:MAG TPA: undecaprenyldiphospho-muramoylpentapeptide beta-N-acetylglucosaminyltransferase [Baekduia sp.]|nr:undecaprenyldiphospho-muramoylpentapeptide beta-N-acetylglucosaminyltransferase [Baekduia sp.]
MPSIVIAAGGTAGHVVPSLAVADALRARGADVSFIGGDRVETELVPAAGYELAQIKVRGVSRSNPLKAVTALALALRAVVRAFRLLGRQRPDAVLGGGGYVAGVVGFAAVLRGIPLVLTEADSHLGVSNRLLARRARRVCLAFALPGRDAPTYLVTGRPVTAPDATRAAGRSQFGIDDDERCVLVFGGSLGARSLNTAAVAAFADAPFRVIHACGRRDYDDLRDKVQRPGYDLRAYISPFGPALAAADLVVARAGGSVFEVAAYGLPAILVPYPHASADHQTSNAAHFADAGAAIVVTDAELDGGRLRAAVDALLADPERLRSMAAASASLARPDAAEAVASEVLTAAGEDADR